MIDVYKRQGLALSKEIVNLHHGSIYAESPEGQGAVFTVELLMDKEHYRPSEVDFYVSDTETAPTSSEEEAVTNIPSVETTEEEPEIDSSLPVSYTHLCNPFGDNFSRSFSSCIGPFINVKGVRSSWEILVKNLIFISDTFCSI